MIVFAIVGLFILLDIVTGIVQALYNEGLNSTILRKGLFHKLSEILAVVLSVLLEYAGNLVNIGVELPLVEGVVAYICLMETVSIIENICAVNPMLSKLFTPYLNKLKNKETEK